VPIDCVLGGTRILSLAAQVVGKGVCASMMDSYWIFWKSPMDGTKSICLRAAGLSLALVLTVVLPSVASAFPVTVEFTGHVTQVDDDLFGWFHGSVPVGTLITGAYTFESTTPDTNPDAGVGHYTSSLYGNGLDAYFSIYHLHSPSPLDVTVINEVGKDDAYKMNASWRLSFLSPPNTPIVPMQFILDLSDRTGQVWSSDALPLSSPSFGSWTEAQFLFTAGYEVPDTVIRGQLDSLAIVATPEPSTLLLLGSALAGLGGITWRRHRRG
jgi:hypothetical protein